MTYKIGDFVERDENWAFPADLSQWLVDNDANIQFKVKPDGTSGYMICANIPVPSNAQPISDYMMHLTTTDYLAIKYAEGELTEEEYAPIRALRRQWRQRINELEGN